MWERARTVTLPSSHACARTRTQAEWSMWVCPKREGQEVARLDIRIPGGWVGEWVGGGWLGTRGTGARCRLPPRSPTHPHAMHPLPPPPPASVCVPVRAGLTVPVETGQGLPPTPDNYIG